MSLDGAGAPSKSRTQARCTCLGRGFSGSFLGLYRMPNYSGYCHYVNYGNFSSVLRECYNASIYRHNLPYLLANYSYYIYYYVYLHFLISPLFDIFYIIMYTRQNKPTSRVNYVTCRENAHSLETLPRFSGAVCQLFLFFDKLPLAFSSARNRCMKLKRLREYCFQKGFQKGREKGPTSRKILAIVRIECYNRCGSQLE